MPIDNDRFVGQSSTEHDLRGLRNSVALPALGYTVGRPIGRTVWDGSASTSVSLASGRNQSNQLRVVTCVLQNRRRGTPGPHQRRAHHETTHHGGSRRQPRYRNPRSVSGICRRTAAGLWIRRYESLASSSSRPGPARPPTRARNRRQRARAHDCPRTRTRGRWRPDQSPSRLQMTQVAARPVVQLLTFVPPSWSQQSTRWLVIAPPTGREKPIRTHGVADRRNSSQPASSITSD